MNKRESFSALLIVGILLPFSVTSYAVDEKTSSTASNNTQYSGEYSSTKMHLNSVCLITLVPNKNSFSPPKLRAWLQPSVQHICNANGAFIQQLPLVLIGNVGKLI